MYDFEPNEQQQKIIDWAKNGEGNMMVKARAGTGKTTTIEMIVQNISNPSLVMCFNKHIAEELLQRNNLERFL
jgi:excinuclease UvrABC helicase subunit UvrB